MQNLLILLMDLSYYVLCKMQNCREILSKLCETPDISLKSTKQTESISRRNIFFYINICEQREPGKRRDLQNNHGIIYYFKHDIKVTKCLGFGFRSLFVYLSVCFIGTLLHINVKNLELLFIRIL